MIIVSIKAVFGEEEKLVTVDLPNGIGGYSYHVNVAGYYHGVILFPPDWPVRWHIHPDSELCTDDILLLVDLISKHRQENADAYH